MEKNISTPPRLETTNQPQTLENIKTREAFKTYYSVFNNSNGN